MTTEPPVNRLIRIAFESPDEVHALLRQEPALLEARTGLEETALRYLAVENQLRAVILLVEAGARVNTLNSCGGTPLSEAASLGYVELVEYLLSQGAHLHLTSQTEPALHEAVRGSNAAVVQLLLAAGADIDEQNIYAKRLFILQRRRMDDSRFLNCFSGQVLIRRSGESLTRLPLTLRSKPAAMAAWLHWLLLARREGTVRPKEPLINEPVGSD